MAVLADTVSVVTGAASGIGRAAALHLGALGSNVVAIDRDVAALASLRAEIGDGVEAVTVDLARSEAIPDVVAGVLARWRRIDHLVNCAGITGRFSLKHDIDLHAWDEVYAVNVKAPLLLIQHAARDMIARGNGGSVVNVTSSSAFRARGAQIGYSSSKAALTQLTRSAAAELGSSGITVNAVAPGLTRTPMGKALGDEDRLSELVSGSGPISNLLKRVGEPDDAAAVIGFLCTPGARQITGQTIHVSAGAVV